MVMEKDRQARTRVRGIVCDVGHVIIRDSVLNHVLRRIGAHDVSRVLYDMRVLAGKDAQEVERWVDAVIREKVAAFESRSAREIQDIAREVALTPGIRRLLWVAQRRGVPVLLMGAVPALVTRALLTGMRVTVDEVVGTDVAVTNGRIGRVRSVCTPLRKAEAVKVWLRRRKLKRRDCVVIGDSIGDVPAMRLVPRCNRVGFNATHRSVKRYVGRNYAANMHELTRWLFQ